MSRSSDSRRKPSRSVAADRKSTTGQKGGVNSVEVAGSLFRAISEAAGPARLSDIARATGMPTAKAHRYIVSLVRAGLVERDPSTGHYDLGPLSLRAGIVALSRSDALKRAERVLHTIVERTGETAAAAVWGSHGPTLVRLVEARHELATSVPLGHVCALTFSAVGLVYCAFSDTDRIAAILVREMAQNRAVGRPGAPTSKAELERRLTTVRSASLATVKEGDGGLSAVSAPVFDSNRQLRLALTVFGRSGRLDISPSGPVATLIREAARSLSGELHGALASAARPPVR
jgi:DNA-binding IclR family transcriptional regulator